VHVVAVSDELVVHHLGGNTAGWVAAGRQARTAGGEGVQRGGWESVRVSLGVESMYLCLRSAVNSL
jgi:hypothetical protein